MNVNLITSIVVCTLGLQTLMLIVLILRQESKGTAQRLLVVLLGFYLLSLLNLANAYMLQTLGYLAWIPYLQLELLLGFGPSLYLYTKSLTDQSYQFKNKEWLHFVPVALEFIYYRTPLFRNGALELTESIHSTGNLIFLLVQWGGLLSVVIYLLASLGLLSKYKKWAKDHYADLENRALSWYEKPVIAYAVFWLVWIGLRVFDILFFEENLRPYYFNLGFVVVAMITLWIGFKGYLKTQSQVAGFLSESRQSSTQKEVDEEQLKRIAQALQIQMSEEKYYLESDLTIAKLAAKTNFSAKDISGALNYCLNQNFHQFVNQYRVEAFKENLEREDLAHLNLLGIALESGFGSKSTFNLVFKASTGMTPKQYLKKMEVKKS